MTPEYPRCLLSLVWTMTSCLVRDVADRQTTCPPSSPAPSLAHGRYALTFSQEACYDKCWLWNWENIISPFIIHLSITLNTLSMSLHSTFVMDHLGMSVCLKFSKWWGISDKSMSCFRNEALPLSYTGFNRQFHFLSLSSWTPSIEGHHLPVSLLPASWCHSGHKEY